MIPRVLSLFDRSGVWAEPYRKAGADVQCIDLARGDDVRLLPYLEDPPVVILAAPPCTHFAVSGARWWDAKGDQALTDALALVDATLRLVALYRPRVWVLENPIGRLVRWLGPPRFRFNPCDFAGWADDPDAEAYTKRTCLWGEFREPERKPVISWLGSKMHLLPPSEDRGALRSVTPQGFARAFAEANPAMPTPPRAAGGRTD